MLEGKLSSEKPNKLERIITRFESKFNPDDKPKTLWRRFANYMKNWAIYPHMGGLLPGDAQAKYCRSAGIKPNTMSKYAIGLGMISQAIKIAAGYGLISLASIGYAPVVIGSGLLVAAGIVGVDLAVRSAYTFTTKKPIGTLPVEIPYRLAKAGYIKAKK